MLEKPTRRIRRFRMRGQKCFKQLLPFKPKIAKTSGFLGNLTFLALRFVSRNDFQSSAPLIDTVEFTAPFYGKFETFRFGNRPHFQKIPSIMPLRGAERHHHIFRASRFLWLCADHALDARVADHAAAHQARLGVDQPAVLKPGKIER